MRITIQINLKVADFLDATLSLNSESYYPYRKPNDRPVYIHSQSNHPPNIIKNLPASISRHLTDISNEETAFGEAKPMYDKALADSGFCEMTEFLKVPEKQQRKEKTEEPSSKYFLVQPSVQPECFNEHRSEIPSKHFSGSSKLSKIFNINMLKLSYSCMPNMAADQSTQQLDPSGWED